MIYQESFNKSKVNTVLGYASNINPSSQIHKFDTQAVVKFIQIDNETSSEDAVFINLAYAIPNKEYIDRHKLKIDKKRTSLFRCQINKIIC